MFEQEYETLRQQLNDNKKYILERPLFIITAGLVLFDYIDGSEYIRQFIEKMNPKNTRMK
jgi:hypothetical protein